MTVRILRLCLLVTAALMALDSVRAQGKATIVDSRSSQLTIDYYPVPHASKPVQIGGKTYITYRDAENSLGTSSNVFGLPVETFLVGIPPDGLPDVQVVTFKSVAKSNVSLCGPSSITVREGKIPQIERGYVPVATPSSSGSGATSKPRISISKIFTIRSQRIAVVEVNPYDYDPATGMLKAYTSIRLRIGLPNATSGKYLADPQYESVLKGLLINYDQAKQWRMSAPYRIAATPRLTNVFSSGPNYSWFNPSQQYYKGKIAADGIFRVTYGDIQRLGLVPENVDPRRIEIFYKGVSVSLRSIGEADGQFNQNDFIEFYGSKLYDGPAVSNEFSDTSTYWLSLQGNNGPRTEIDSTIAGSPNVIADYFNATYHSEVDSIYYFGDQGLPNNNQTAKVAGEGWYWNTLYGGQTMNIPLSLDNIYKTGNPNFQISVKVHSTVFNQSTPNHLIEVIVNGTSLGTDTLAGYQDKTIVVSGPVSLLANGNNIVTLNSKQTNAALNEVMVDWFELRLPHGFQAMNDSITFVPDRITPSLVAAFQIGGFSTSDITAYRLDTLGNIDKVFTGSITSNAGSYSFSFTDTVAIRRRYIAVTGSHKLSSPPFTAKTFVNLRSTTLGADYLVITASDFLIDANRLASYRAQTGIGRTKVVSVSDIYDEFGFGLFDPTAIRRFLETADSLWVAPKPSYIVFFGDANWDYKNILKTTRTNFVPSLGNPVSDDLFVSSASDPFLPTKFIGRIPCGSQSGASVAVDRIINYESTPLSIWNKRYMFLVGGFDSLETSQFSQFSDILINQYIAPSPLTGLPSRLYRTTSQVIQFDLTQEAKQIISDGAVWLNYYGHGGTELWGNGITSPDQLENAEGKRHVISDISCSTARFAEPNVDSFAEQMYFGDQGGAIAYFGSSGFGFSSPLQVIAQALYKQMAVDSIREVGRLLLGAKVSLWSGGTWSIINQEALQQYTLIGDPALKIAVPELPDYAANSNQISSNPILPSDSDSLIALSAILSNYGLHGSDSVEVLVTHKFQSLTETVLDRRISSIGSLDTLSFTSSSFSRGGVHQLKVSIDPNNKISEVTKTNNIAEFSLFVNSGSILPILPLSSSGIHPDSVTLVLQNPGKSAMQSWRLVVELDTSSAFIGLARIHMQDIVQGIVTTKAQVPIGVLHDTTLYYWRGRFVGPSDSINWVGGYFLTNKALRAPWIQDRPSLFVKNSDDGLAIGNSVRLDAHRSPVTVYSGGFNDGNSALISLDNVNLTQGFAGRGYNVAVVNQYSGKLETFGAFNVYSDAGDTTLSQPLTTFLNNIPTGRKVFMAIMDEGAKGKSEALNEAVEACGSALIRSVGFRGSWALIGWKGAPIGSVPEGVEPSGSGPVTLVDTLTFQSVFGSMLTPSIGPSQNWRSLSVSVDTSVRGTHFSVDVFKSRKDGGTDTLTNISLAPNGLSSIVPSSATGIRLRANLSSDSVGLTPHFSKWSINFDPPPELAINYQTVSISSDSVLEGTPITVRTIVYNIGASPADSVLVTTSFTNLTNGRTSVDSATIPVIGPNSSASLSQQLQTTGHIGANIVLVQIDPRLSIPEIFKSNNALSLPVTVRSDTAHPTFTISVDGSPVYNGDYVSTNPTILVDIFSSNPLPITDPRSIMLLLDNQPVTLGTSPDSLFESRSGPDKALVTYRPRLQKGDHTLSVQVMTASGNIADTTARQVTFKVETEPGLLNVYNYPNPFAHQTQFTFNLVGSKLPDDLKIKIYSIAGRLIQELTVWRADLRIGFNRVPWDGRDRDGDVLANGVYLYKVVMSVDGKSEEVIQKLAIVK